MSWTKKDILIGLGVLVLFFVLRVDGIDNLYHQDEYKWPIIVNPALTEPGGIPHPPVGEFIYRELGALVGYDNFRIIPLAFSFLNMVLLFYLAKMVGDKKSALWSVFFFAVSFYSVLASLMVDTDGAIMPTFFLIMCIGHFKLRAKGFELSKNWAWFVILVVGAVAGFFVKASFVIAIAALALDFAFEKNVFSDRRKILKYFAYALSGAVFLGLLLLLAKLLFPFFKLEASLKYWEHFVRFGGRGWLQTMIQLAKSIMYLSPLLVLPILFLQREMISRYRPFILFIIVGLFFYLVAFDFSSGALDRYFQFLILPLVVLVGALFAQTSPPAPLLVKEGGKKTEFSWGEVVIPVIFAIVIFSLQFFNHFVPPHYPKTEWLERALSLKWNFLFPFTGGSGPTGFYVSFAFIATIWICSLVFAFWAMRKAEFKRGSLVSILVLGLLYNGVFIEEYLWGKINGSPYRLFASSEAYIAEHEEIEKVVVYNDIGGYEIQKTGKYARRLYATPQFESTYRDFFKDFSGHILYIDIPRIDENNFYSKYLSSCKNIYEKNDRYITTKIFKCNE